MQIYLDYSATTKPHPEVIATMTKVMQADWGNPSSLHSWGERAATVLEIARMQVADLIKATAEAIIFTSGGTEADNLAIFGITQQYPTPQHLIISSVEHPAISQPVAWLESQGWQVTRLAVNRQGSVNPEDLKAAIQANTVLISVIYGQSEVGTLQPIAELGAIAHGQGIPFHTDGVQVAGRIPIDVSKLPVDLLSLSSHKLYGPQGAGALYIRPGITIKPLLWGGGQELGQRSGTQALPAIAGFGVACELAQGDLPSETLRLQQLRDYLWQKLAPIPYLIPTGDRHNRLPHHLSFILKGLPGVTGKTLVRQLNLAGIGISSGSACHSGKLTPSPILLALGYSPAEAVTGIRLSLGKDTTLADLDWTALVLTQILSRLSPSLVSI